MKYEATITKAMVIGLESPVIYKGDSQDYEKAHIYQGDDIIKVNAPIGTFKIDANKRIDIPVKCNHFMNSNGFIVHSMRSNYTSTAVK